MSAPAQKAIVKSIQRIMSPLPLKKPPLARAERDLERVEKLIELFEPFILHNDHVFDADNVERLSLRAAGGRERRVRVRPAIHRLVGLLDQHSHSGAAQVVLSSDRGPAAGSAACRAVCSLLPSRKTAKWSKLAPTEQRGDIPDRFHRIHRRACCRQSAGAAWRIAESAGSRPRSAGSRRPSVAGSAVASGISAILRVLPDAHANFLRRSHCGAFWACAKTTTTA